MACSIVDTPSGATSNSYCSIVFANEYHDTVVQYEAEGTPWEDAGDDEKCRALVTATRLLDVWFDWFGDISTLTQRLMWPRRGVLRPGISEGVVGSETVNPWHEPFQTLLDSDTVPERIKEATAELARHLLVSNRSADSDIETQGIKSLTAGPVSLTFAGAVAKPVPDAVLVMVSTLGTKRSRSGGTVHMYRG
jgi:hypothetical protein